MEYLKQTPTDLHGKLGESCQATGDSKLAIYHYTQQLNLVSSPGTWNNIALVYLADNQPYQVLLLSHLFELVFFLENSLLLALFT